MAGREQIYEMVLAVETARRNPRTAQEDDKVWRDFQEFEQLRGFDPNLKPEWVMARPERYKPQACELPTACSSAYEAALACEPSS